MQIAALDDKPHCIRPRPLDYTGNVHRYYDDCDFAPFRVADLTADDRANDKLHTFFYHCPDSTWSVVYTGGDNASATAAVMGDVKVCLTWA